jgi:hypothetical protein
MGKWVGSPTYLAETSASGESSAVGTLHKSGGRDALAGAEGGLDADIAVAL